MTVNKLKLLTFGAVSCAAIATTITIVQMRKHGGHITVGIGDRELSWIYDGKKDIREVGED